MALFNPADYVRITNEDPQSVERGKKLVRGRFNGEDYVFPFGVAVDIPIDAANHIFGLNSDDKSNALARLGWAQSSSDVDSAIERLKRIRFEDLPQFVEVPRAKRTASTQTEHARPLVKVGGNPGAAASAVAPEDPPVDEDAQGDEPDIAQAI